MLRERGVLGQTWSDLEQYASCAQHLTGTQFTGFTGTKVQILTLLEEVPVADARGRQLHRYTCFIRTKVLAVLVQKYKY